MSTGADYEVFPEFVLIRGFRGRPAKLRPVGVRDCVVDVVGSDPEMPMPQRSEHVFNFDADLFGRLTEAFARNDGTVDAMWGEATPAALPEPTE